MYDCHTASSITSAASSSDPSSSSSGGGGGSGGMCDPLNRVLLFAEYLPTLAELSHWHFQNPGRAATPGLFTLCMETLAWQLHQLVKATALAGWVQVPTGGVPGDQQQQQQQQQEPPPPPPPQQQQQQQQQQAEQGKQEGLQKQQQPGKQQAQLADQASAVASEGGQAELLRLGPVPGVGYLTPAAALQVRGST
jgi:hypothetical protein